MNRGNADMRQDQEEIVR